METKKCLQCGEPFQGRSDKRFCDDYCRNAYNNALRKETNKRVRTINSILKKNRDVLEEIMEGKEDTVKTTQEKLLHAGFQFKYFTHLYTTKKGKVYHYCYDYGYLALENDWFLIVRDRE